MTIEVYPRPPDVLHWQRKCVSVCVREREVQVMVNSLAGERGTHFFTPRYWQAMQVSIRHLRENRNTVVFAVSNYYTVMFATQRR